MGRGKQNKRPSVVRDGLRPQFLEGLNQARNLRRRVNQFKFVQNYATKVGSALCSDSTAGLYLTRRDVEIFFYEKVLFPFLTASSQVGETKKLTKDARIGIACKLFDEFFETLESLPKEYEITIRCPSLVDIRQEIKELACFSISREQRKPGEPPDKKRVQVVAKEFYDGKCIFLTTKSSGWLNRGGGGSALRNAIVLFKQMAGLSLALDLFVYAPTKLEPPRPTMRIRNLEDDTDNYLWLGDAFENLVTNLSWHPQFSRTSSDSVGSNVGKRVRIIESMMQTENELARSVLSSCAWYCDALSEINETNGFIYTCFGLESLLRCNYSQRGGDSASGIVIRQSSNNCATEHCPFLENQLVKDVR